MRGATDRVHLTVADAAALAAPDAPGGYDVVFACECVHDMADPVGALQTMRGLAGDDGTVIVMDERTAESFAAPGEPLERLLYGFSLTCCLPDGLSHPPAVGTGTVMRPATLEGYAQEAGFAGIDILSIDNDFFRFYRLRR